MTYALTTIQDIVGEFSGFVDKIIPSSAIPILVQLCATAVLFIIVAKFVFKPVRKILKQRQDYVESQLRDAEASKARSLEYEKTAQASIDEAREKSKTILLDAKLQAEAGKEKAMEELNEEIRAARRRTEEEIRQEKQATIEEVRKQIVDVALQASEAVLNREINEQDQSKLVEEFVKEAVK